MGHEVAPANAPETSTVSGRSKPHGHREVEKEVSLANILRRKQRINACERQIRRDEERFAVNVQPDIFYVLDLPAGDVGNEVGQQGEHSKHIGHLQSVPCAHIGRKCSGT